jgi:ammonia channel protein AmtB
MTDQATPAVLNPFLDEALTSSWTMSCASIVLISTQVGFTLLELAQTHKKNRDYIIVKNLLVFLTALLTWFVAGFAIAFGIQPNAEYLQVGGFRNGWFGDFKSGYTYEEGNKEFMDRVVIFNQRRFFVYFSFQILASNITTSSIAERVKLRSIVGFVVL